MTENYDNGKGDGFTFHERRKQTFYLVGVDDLEPFVSDLINKAYSMA